MRRPTRQLVIASIVCFLLSFPLSWGLMVALKAELRFYGFGTLTFMALLFASLMIFILDKPLNLRTFDWPTPDEEVEVKNDNLRHFIIVALLIIITSIVSLLFLNSLNMLPTPASAQSESIDFLVGLHMALIAVLFALVSVFMVYSIIVFRRKDGDDSDGKYFHGHTGLEIVWTVIPLALVVYFGFLGVQSLQEVTAAQPNELVVEVEGYQWGWRFYYPEYDKRSPGEMYLPLDRPVLLKMNSVDVIHSFWVPEFRVKQDLVPGRTTTLRVTPTLPGQFKLRCAELCGTSHYNMLADVNVLYPDAFEAWATGTELAAPDATPEERGAAIAEANGCTACHSSDGSPLVGPTWKGLYGKEETLDGGVTVTVDDVYLHQSIVDPNSQIVEGFPPAMPATYGDVLSEDDINNIIAYIESLAN